MTNGVPKQTGEINLAEISRRTGLVIRQPDSISSLFDELERYELQERAETFDYLKRALNETRSALGAEVFTEMSGISGLVMMKTDSNAPGFY